MSTDITRELNPPQEAHSKLGASSMYRWSQCPGSVRLCEGLPDVQSPYAQEGTLAHEIAAAILFNEQPKTQPDAEMYEHVMVYVEHCRGLVTHNSSCFIEHRFDLSTIYPGLFGTADYVVFDRMTRTLFVRDLKYGAGIAVEVKDNQQLLYYALGALLSLGFPARTVDIGIVQPRCPHLDGPIRSIEIAASDLVDFAGQLVELAEATEKIDAPLMVGDHCRFCKAAPKCPELHRTSVVTAKKEFSPTKAYDPADLAATLSKIDVIEAWCASVRSFAYAEASRGRQIPGFKLVAKRATRSWKEDILDLPKALAVRFGQVPREEFLEPAKVKSPAQVEKILQKYGEEKKALGELVQAISSGFKLVPESDSGEAARLGPATEFEKVG